MQVKDVMSTGVEFITADSSVKEAAELMGELDVGALPVGSAAALDGVVTDRDILFRVVAAGRDPSTTPVRAILSQPVVSCRTSDALTAVMDLMAANHVRRLPVTDERGHVVGWITLADLSRKLLVDSDDLQSALVRLTEHRDGSAPVAAVDGADGVARQV